MIHHVLAVGGYTLRVSRFSGQRCNPAGRRWTVEVLESYSRPLLPLIEWRTTPTHNVEVLNDTARFYRYFDATRHAEFLYDCVAQTVEHDLPDEVAFLEAYDRFDRGLQSIVDMPTRSVELLRKFLSQGDGYLSARARQKEFAMLSDAECSAIEQLYGSTFKTVGGMEGPDTTAG